MPKDLRLRTGFFPVWEKYVRTGEVSNISAQIRSSWERCNKFGVNPFQDISPQIIDQQAVITKIQENEDLHKLIQYHCQKIVSETDLSIFNILFSDPCGYVLSIEGHDKILQVSENTSISLGFNISEASVGTTAPGVSLVDQKPSLVHAEEHFSQMFHWASCFAVPIFDHKNKIAGCLNISTTSENRLRLEKMVPFFYSIASSFQFEHFIKKKFQELKLYSAFFDSTFKYADKNLILINTHLSIINLNAKAGSSLGIDAFCLYGGRNVLSLLNIDTLRFEKLLDSKGVDSFDLFCKGEYKRFSIQALPIYDPSGNTTSYLLEFEPMTKKTVMPEKFKNQARYTFNDIIGTSRKITGIIDRAKKAAKGESTILIEGKTGTGKELLAHAIHNESRFSKGPLIAINCSAIPGELVESELFGYEKGSYTGALRSGGTGKFEMANNGTLFLDEIHTMSLISQMKILRTLEDRSVMRIGGRAPIPLNVRIIAATSENLEMEVEKGSFLSALFFRLNVVRLQIPELKDRKGDIPLLVDYFIGEMNRQFDRSITGVDKEGLDALLNHSWPGNIRELKNAVESAFNFCEGDTIDLDNLNITAPPRDRSCQEEQGAQTMEALTRKMLSEALNRFGNVNEAAAFLSIPVSTFYRKMKKFKLSK